MTKKKQIPARWWTPVAVLLAATLLPAPQAWAQATHSCRGRAATIVGTEGDDVISGTTGNDVIVGLGGDDFINARPGEDYICGGPGSDRLKGGGGYDDVDGGTGDDALFGGKRPDYLYPGPGNDHIDGGLEYGYGYGGGYSGNYWDYVFYDDLDGVVVDLRAGFAQADGRDRLSRIEGVVGSPGADTIRGAESDDRLLGGGGNDILSGRGGNDDIIPGAGDDDITGGPGRDSVAFESQGEPIVGPVKVNLAAGRSKGQGADTLASVEDVSGTRRDDLLIGNEGDNVLRGYGGADEIEGGAGNDSLFGGDAFKGTDRDVLKGDAGRDRLFGGTGRDRLEGGGGNDLLGGTSATRHVVTVPCTKEDDDQLIGGRGSDMVTYFSCRREINVNLSSGRATGGGRDELVDVERVEAGFDHLGTLAGTDKDEKFKVTGGAGTIDAGGGNDTLVIEHARTRADLPNRSLRLDREESFLGGIENVTSSYMEDVLIGDGNDNLLSAAEGDDTLIGGGGDDTLTGGEGGKHEYGRDTLDGGRGDDSLAGGGAPDVLAGGAGNDRLSGGLRNDRLDGGRGRDVLRGGGGTDHCINGERVKDCEAEEEPDDEPGPQPTPAPTSSPIPGVTPPVPTQQQDQVPAAPAQGADAYRLGIGRTSSVTVRPRLQRAVCREAAGQPRCPAAT